MANLLAISVFWLAGTVQAEEARLCHIANAGFYVTDGEKGVLLDAVLGEPYPPYQQPSDSLNADIEASTGAFSDVKLVFASHFHGDHFDGPAMLRHMAANPDARYIIPPQAFEKMPGAGNDSRIHSKMPADNRPDRVTMNGIPVTLYRVSHGANRRIDNLGIYFELAGKSFFHPGDISTSLADLQKAGIDKLDVDYLLVPFWQLLDAEEIAETRQAFTPKTVVPMHIVKENFEDWSKARNRILASFPDTLEMFGEMDCHPL